jgi:hypothetical protein
MKYCKTCLNRTPLGLKNLLNLDRYLVYTGSNKMKCELMFTYDTPAYMFNVYKSQLSRQTGSKNLMGPKTLPTIWGTYMKL